MEVVFDVDDIDGLLYVVVCDDFECSSECLCFCALPVEVDAYGYVVELECAVGRLWFIYNTVGYAALFIVAVQLKFDMFGLGDADLYVHVMPGCYFLRFVLGVPKSVCGLCIGCFGSW